MGNREIAHRLAVDSVNDYCASRLLIREEFILNSIQLACTSVEKLLKAFLYLQTDSNVQFEHDPFKIYKKNENVLSKQFIFNKDFFKWLGKVYRSRYTSDYGARKEIQFGEKQFLAELDHTFFQVFSYFKISNYSFSDVYFSNHRNEIKHYENYIYLNKVKDDYKCESQRIFVFQLFGVEHFDITIEIKAFNPSKPFVFKDSIIKDGNSMLNIEFGAVHLD